MIDKEKPIKVIYCEDCCHFAKDEPSVIEGYCFCYRNTRFVPENFYCADGERREEDENDLRRCPEATDSHMAKDRPVQYDEHGGRGIYQRD